MKKSPVVLIIRDGWGFRKDMENNALATADAPNHDKYLKEYPNTLIDAAGPAVGLPEGYQGNSEVGHLTIGAGKVIFQPLMRINKAIETKEFFDIPEFNSSIENCMANNSTLHIIGLLQVEGVHSHIDHLMALLDLCALKDFKRVLVHVVTDGRDAPVDHSLIHLNTLLGKFKELGFGQIATISGRFYTMDRDQRWDRTKKAYDCIVKGISKNTFQDPLVAVKECHGKDETDEFIVPRKADWFKGLNDGDSMIFYNFRTDRTRQLTKAIVEEEFEGWEREMKKVHFSGMTQYYRPMNAHVAFKDVVQKGLLGEIISEHGLKQLRISETEKYAHVTFFFNGQREEVYPNENRIMISSPKVNTYDLKPEMSVYEIADALVEELDKNQYDLVVVNLVNCDMVGHTGKVNAILKAVESVDKCVGKIVKMILELDGVALLFADHGNAEDQRPEWSTSHTLNRVPLTIVSNLDLRIRKQGGLKNIAPTVLHLLGIEIPEDMAESMIL